MKHIFYVLILLMISCSEDYIGQHPVDKIPPGSIKNAAVTNLPGSSLITYELPSDEDILYVKHSLVWIKNGKRTRATHRPSALQLQY